MLPAINLSHKLNTFHIILLRRYQLAISKVFWQCNLYILFTHLLALRLSIVLVGVFAFGFLLCFFIFLFFFFFFLFSFLFYILFQFSLKIEQD